MNAQAAPAGTAQGRDPSNLFKDVQGTVSAVERGDWVTAGLGIANSAMDIVGLASNPLSGFLSAGFSWALEHVDFLREPFDALLGDPQAISKMAESWKSAGTQVSSVAGDYKRTAVEQTKTWEGKTADAYRGAAANHSTGLETLSKACAGISGAVAGAGQLVAAVRKMIMDLISDAVAKMVMKIIQWLTASVFTFGAAIGAAIADIVTMACDYAKKLSDFLSKLASSLTKLMNLVKQVASIAQTAKQIVDAITAMSHKGAAGGGAGGGPSSTRPSAGGLGMNQGQVDQLRQQADGRYTNPGSSGAGTGTTGTSGSGGGQVSAPPPVPGAGHWEPGRWVPDAPAASGGTVAPPPVVGGSGPGYPGYRATPSGPTGVPVRPEYTPPPGSTGDLHTTATRSGGFTGSLPGGGAGGGAGGGFSGGGAGGGAGGFSGASGAGGGGAGAGGAMQPGGATGVLPSGTPGHSAFGGAGGVGGGGAPHGGGAAGGGMMGGAPMGAGGQGGDGKDHQRKVRIEGEELIEPLKASKPVIGE